MYNHKIILELDICKFVFQYVSKNDNIMCRVYEKGFITKEQIVK